MECELHLKNLIGNNKQKNSIIAWLKQFEQHKFEKQKHCCLCIVGEQGSGKTTTIKVILNDLGFNVHNIDLLFFMKDNISINQLFYQSTINEFIMNKVNKKILLIDDVETIVSNMNKKILYNILNYNEKVRKMPIILILNDKQKKLSQKIKHISDVILFNKPTNKDLTNLLIRLCRNNKIKFENKEIITKFIDYSQNDYCKLIKLFNCLTEKNKKITKKIFNDHVKIFKKKDEKVDIFKSTINILNGMYTLNEILQIYNNEKIIIPLMIQQNFVNYKINNDNLNKISKSIAFSDIVENQIYNNQNWYLYDIHCFFSCMQPAYLLSKTNSKKYKLEFPKDLNKKSTKQLNKKTLNYLINNYLKTMNISDMMSITELTKLLISDNKFKECVDLFKSYGMNTDDIMLILRINKINPNKSKLSNKIKTKIKEYF